MAVSPEIARHQPGRAAALPPLWLAIALVSVFVFQDGTPGFQPGHHGSLSSHGMAIAAHLAPEHRFLMVNRIVQDEDGAVQYEVYNRFPMGAFAAIRLVTLPFRHDLSMQIAVASNLMKVFFIGAACLAYLAILRLSKSSWVAVTAVLLTFSSYYCLYYNDMIFNDVPTLFGLLLVFHGMVVFVQDGRFTPLLIKTCVAVSLGWQVYAILLPFTILGCISELGVSRSVRALVRSRFVILGVSCVLFGGLVLASNLVGESLALDVTLRELPSFERMLWRLGLGGSQAYEEYAVALNWLSFAKHQLYRVGRMSLPHILVRSQDIPVFFAAFGLCVFVISLVGAVISRSRMLMLTLVISGFCWALPMRHFVTFHDFQSLFYVGVPLVFYAMVAQRAERWSVPSSIALTCVAILVFILSSLNLNIEKAGIAGTENVLTADFQRIANQVGTGRTIYVDGDYDTIGEAKHAVGFFLAGSYFASSAEDAEFILSADRIEGASLISPDNQRVFLYRRSESGSSTEGTHHTSEGRSSHPTKADRPARDST